MLKIFMRRSQLIPCRLDFESSSKMMNNTPLPRSLLVVSKQPQVKVSGKEDCLKIVENGSMKFIHITATRKELFACSIKVDTNFTNTCR